MVASVPCLSATVPADDRPPLTSDMQPISTFMETTGIHRKTSGARWPGETGSGRRRSAVRRPTLAVPQDGRCPHEICRLVGAPGAIWCAVCCVFSLHCISRTNSSSQANQMLPLIDATEFRCVLLSHTDRVVFVVEISEGTTSPWVGILLLKWCILVHSQWQRRLQWRGHFPVPVPLPSTRTTLHTDLLIMFRYNRLSLLFCRRTLFRPILITSLQWWLND